MQTIYLNRLLSIKTTFRECQVSELMWTNSGNQAIETKGKLEGTFFSALDPSFPDEQIISESPRISNKNHFSLSFIPEGSS